MATSYNNKKCITYAPFVFRGFDVFLKLLVKLATAWKHKNFHDDMNGYQFWSPACFSSSHKIGYQQYRKTTHVSTSKEIQILCYEAFCMVTHLGTCHVCMAVYGLQLATETVLKFLSGCSADLLLS